jgi:hypothetical protein
MHAWFDAAELMQLHSPVVAFRGDMLQAKEI